ncbi:hypothetical protein HK405_007958, partial [Cladochytrium tenue]
SDDALNGSDPHAILVAKAAFYSTAVAAGIRIKPADLVPKQTELSMFKLTVRQISEASADELAAVAPATKSTAATAAASSPHTAPTKPAPLHPRAAASPATPRRGRPPRPRPADAEISANDTAHRVEDSQDEAELDELGLPPTPAGHRRGAAPPATAAMNGDPPPPPTSGDEGRGADHGQTPRRKRRRGENNGEVGCGVGAPELREDCADMLGVGRPEDDQDDGLAEMRRQGQLGSQSLFRRDEVARRLRAAETWRTSLLAKIMAAEADAAALAGGVGAVLEIPAATA